uniref:DDHD domain-containing protein n=1 Tax=Heterorhabditis bacteriophora TaxID=37862 RepID=A0A1I7XSK6_HETBA
MQIWASAKHFTSSFSSYEDGCKLGYDVMTPAVLLGRHAYQGVPNTPAYDGRGISYSSAKKSRLDSHGKDSGVEIISNKPYSDGPGGSGQYTFKIYHIGSKIPVWIRSVLPTSALEAHEEGWNAYPITKTRYSNPMMDRFSVEVETIYCNDADEDPKLYRSIKTGRGPLTEDWVEEYVKAGKPVMCAYKMCRVEFRYWGMQVRLLIPSGTELRIKLSMLQMAEIRSTRAERWIQDLALRNTMLRAHRQAWAWQDEWVDLTMKDIRRLEAEAALHLSAVMSSNDEVVDDSDTSSDDLYFDCTDSSPPHSSKPSIIRWSSELELEIADENSPPLTPHTSEEAALLIMVFHGDFSPEKPADSKTTDTNTFRSTIETLILRHYPQLKARVHLVLVSCGSELSQTVGYLSAISPSFGVLHPSLSLIISSAHQVYNDAIEGTIRRANDTFTDFIESQPQFSGEVFVVGDAVGGLFLYEAMTKHHDPTNISRHSSSISAKIIPEGYGDVSTHSVQELNLAESSHENGHHRPVRYPRNFSAPPSATFMRKKISIGGSSVDSLNITSRLLFQPTTAFLLGCPLGLVLIQRKLAGIDIDGLESCQLFNLYYPLDPCGSRLEPVLNTQLNILPPANVPKYQRYPLGDGRSLQFDTSVNTSHLWGGKRMDHLLYCPNAMVALPSTALPNILHASYWESCDVAAFIIRQFVRSEEYVLTTLSASMNNIPLKIANLSPNHRANDILVVSGGEQSISAKFCYGPMDLVALTRELVSVLVCPQR